MKNFPRTLCAFDYTIVKPVKAIEKDNLELLYVQISTNSNYSGSLIVFLMASEDICDHGTYHADDGAITKAWMHSKITETCRGGSSLISLDK